MMINIIIIIITIVIISIITVLLLMSPFWVLSLLLHICTIDEALLEPLRLQHPSGGDARTVNIPNCSPEVIRQEQEEEEEDEGALAEESSSLMKLVEKEKYICVGIAVWYIILFSCEVSCFTSCFLFPITLLCFGSCVFSFSFTSFLSLFCSFTFLSIQRRFLFSHYLLIFVPIRKYEKEKRNEWKINSRKQHKRQSKLQREGK